MHSGNKHLTPADIDIFLPPGTEPVFPNLSSAVVKIRYAKPEKHEPNRFSVYLPSSTPPHLRETPKRLPQLPSYPPTQSDTAQSIAPSTASSPSSRPRSRLTSGRCRLAPYSAPVICRGQQRSFVVSDEIPDPISQLLNHSSERDISNSLDGKLGRMRTPERRRE